MTPAEPVSELIKNVSQSFECARSMPPSVYRSPEFLDHEMRDIFAREWICVGRASALPKPGDYLTYELAGQPILVIRDRDGRLRAMSNVCLHRMSTLLEGAGNRRVIVCPYHAWSYNLDGTLRGAPAMTLNTGFAKECYRLPPIRCEERRRSRVHGESVLGGLRRGRKTGTSESPRTSQLRFCPISRSTRRRV